MKKRLRMMMLGAFLLCVLLAAFLALGHIAGPANAASGAYSTGVFDGVESCRNRKQGGLIHHDPSKYPDAQDQSDYEDGWWHGYGGQGC